MRPVIVLSTICAVALAVPVTQTLQDRAATNSTWEPAEGTTTSCDKTSDKIIGFYVGPQMEAVLTDACAAMMPPCAYPSRLADDVACAQVIDWNLDGPKTSTQSANIETTEGNKISGWNVKCKIYLNCAFSRAGTDMRSLSYTSRKARELTRCVLDSTGLLWLFRAYATEG